MKWIVAPGHACIPPKRTVWPPFVPLSRPPPKSRAPYVFRQQRGQVHVGAASHVRAPPVNFGQTKFRIMVRRNTIPVRARPTLSVPALTGAKPTPTGVSPLKRQPVLPQLKHEP